MDTSVFDSLLSPAILFFFLGMIATWIKSGLELPDQISKFLSVYLLMAIGFHGGMELSHSGLTSEVGTVMLMTMIAAALVPLWSFFILRLKLHVYNSAAIAATYGSISAVTFVTAVSVLKSLDIAYSGHMVAAMALMESPAIIVGVLLARYYAIPQGDQPVKPNMNWKSLMKEAIGSGPVVLLAGSLLIGLASGDKGWASVKPVLGDPFTGVLALFLLDMGINAAKHLSKLPESSLFLCLFAIGAALVHAGLGIGTGFLLDVSKGDALLLAVLFGSASYIAVPAAAKLALPQANPGIYVPMSLGITFPFNVVVGIPIYLSMINLLWK